MILLLLMFFFQIFFGGVVPYEPFRLQASVVQVSRGSTVQFPDVPSPLRLDVEVADTAATRERGLMYRTFLGKNNGMIFVFDDDAPRRFWMKNTLIPLDMIFADAAGTVVSVSQNVRPCEEVLRAMKIKTCPSYSSVYPAKYVLEINAGLAVSHAIRPGSHMDISF